LRLYINSTQLLHTGHKYTTQEMTWCYRWRWYLWAAISLLSPWWYYLTCCNSFPDPGSSKDWINAIAEKHHYTIYYAKLTMDQQDVMSYSSHMLHIELASM